MCSNAYESATYITDSIKIWRHSFRMYTFIVTKGVCKITYSSAEKKKKIQEKVLKGFSNTSKCVKLFLLVLFNYLISKFVEEQEKCKDLYIKTLNEN